MELIIAHMNRDQGNGILLALLLIAMAALAVLGLVIYVIIQVIKRWKL